MIVYTRDDVVRLSGSLVKNQWLTIKAAANLLLNDHPRGIIIDCSELTHVSEEGAKTFMDAMRDIQASQSARMVVANLPANVLEVIRSVPGVRSQLPIASSVEEARASLRLSEAAPPTDSEHPPSVGAILVPLMEGLDADFSLVVSGRIARETRLPILLVCLLPVARNLPLGTPLPEAEAAADAMLERAEQMARKLNLPSERHLERVRDPEEGLLQTIKAYHATHVVVSPVAASIDDGAFVDLMDTLLRRAPCDVLIGRRRPESGPRSDSGPAPR